MSIATVLDRFPTPPCALLLGLNILEADREDGTVKISFTAKPEFCNAAGNVQGGLLAAMLDDCMGPAVLIATDAQAYPSTIDLNIQFLAPAKPGRIIGSGRVVQIGKSIGFVESSLEDESGKTIARATSTVRITAIDKVVT